MEDSAIRQLTRNVNSSHFNDDDDNDGDGDGGDDDDDEGKVLHFIYLFFTGAMALNANEILVTIAQNL